MHKFPFSFIVSLALCGTCNLFAPISLLFFSKPAQADSIPTSIISNGGRLMKAPDWSRITWSKFPPIQKSGWIKLPPDQVNKLGYDPSRTWNAGDRPDKFVMLGDTSAFRLEAFSLNDISRLNKNSQQNQNSRLSDFGLIRWQTPATLVAANPDLGNQRLSQVKPLKDLADQNGYGYQYDDDTTVADFLDENPDYANTQLDRLDLNQYSLDSIPGLRQTPISRFDRWQQSYINQVPGLNQVAFSQFPQPLLNSVPAVAVADLVWSAAEYRDLKVGAGYFISGSDRAGFNVPCEINKPCSYLEVNDLAGEVGPLHGRRWVSGASQQVKGGHGILSVINDGKEPTGRLVYGPTFKVVLTDVKEDKGTADFGLYLRFCEHSLFVDLGCTPYFVGPIPWIPAHENDLVIINTVP